MICTKAGWWLQATVSISRLGPRDTANSWCAWCLLTTSPSATSWHGSRLKKRSTTEYGTRHERRYCQTWRNTKVHGVCERKTLRQRRKLMVILSTRWGRGWNRRKCSVVFIFLSFIISYIVCLMHFYRSITKPSNPNLHCTNPDIHCANQSYHSPSLSLSDAWTKKERKKKRRKCTNNL